MEYRRISIEIYTQNTNIHTQSHVLIKIYI